MISYYTIVTELRDHLLLDENVTTVITGSLDKIDLGKQTMFPLAHILVGTGEPNKGLVSFAITITVMDIIDMSNNNPVSGDWKGSTNKQYILNTTLSVVERLTKLIDSGSLLELGWELQSPPIAVPFEDKFENLLTGWSMTFNINIPNTVQHCTT